MVKDGIALKVVEALQDDVYKGIARIDPQLMRKLGINRGDIILNKRRGGGSANYYNYNVNLSPYSSLCVINHEIAHLLAFKKYN